MNQSQVEKERKDYGRAHRRKDFRFNKSNTWAQVAVGRGRLSARCHIYNHRIITRCWNAATF
jgi:hypothetical protein